MTFPASSQSPLPPKGETPHDNFFRQVSARVSRRWGNRETRVLGVTFMEKLVDIYPEDHTIYDGINLVGRSAGIAGARKDDCQPLYQRVPKVSERPTTWSSDVPCRGGEVSSQRSNLHPEGRGCRENQPWCGVTASHIPTILGSTDRHIQRTRRA